MPRAPKRLETLQRVQEQYEADLDQLSTEVDVSADGISTGAL